MGRATVLGLVLPCLWQEGVEAAPLVRAGEADSAIGSAGDGPAVMETARAVFLHQFVEARIGLHQQALPAIVAFQGQGVAVMQAVVAADLDKVAETELAEPLHDPDILGRGGLRVRDISLVHSPALMRTPLRISRTTISASSTAVWATVPFRPARSIHSWLPGSRSSSAGFQ